MIYLHNNHDESRGDRDDHHDHHELPNHDEQNVDDVLGERSLVHDDVPSSKLGTPLAGRMKIRSENRIFNKAIVLVVKEYLGIPKQPGLTPAVFNKNNTFSYVTR